MMWRGVELKKKRGEEGESHPLSTIHLPVPLDHYRSIINIQSFSPWENFFFLLLFFLNFLHSVKISCDEIMIEAVFSTDPFFTVYLIRQFL